MSEDIKDDRTALQIRDEEIARLEAERDAAIRDRDAACEEADIWINCASFMINEEQKYGGTHEHLAKQIDALEKQVSTLTKDRDEQKAQFLDLYNRHSAHEINPSSTCECAVCNVHRRMAEAQQQAGQKTSQLEAVILALHEDLKSAGHDLHDAKKANEDHHDLWRRRMDDHNILRRGVHKALKEFGAEPQDGEEICSEDVEWLIKCVRVIIQERDDAIQKLGKAVCAYCQTETEKSAEAILDHMEACEKHPYRNVVEIQKCADDMEELALESMSDLAVCAKENEEARSILSKVMGDWADGHKPTEVTTWDDAQAFLMKRPYESTT